MIVVILISLLYTSPEIHIKGEYKVPYYCVPVVRTESNEQHPHPSEAEVVSVFELAGTYYGEAIGAEFIYPEVLFDY